MIPNPESLDQGLIVSVQAPQGSPMRDPDVIAAMADSALRMGLWVCAWKALNTSVLCVGAVRTP